MDKRSFQLIIWMYVYLCLSVRHVRVLCRNRDKDRVIVGLLLYSCYRTRIGNCTKEKYYGEIPPGSIEGTSSAGRVYEKPRSSTNISLCLGNDARLGHSLVIPRNANRNSYAIYRMVPF